MTIRLGLALWALWWGGRGSESFPDRPAQGLSNQTFGMVVQGWKETCRSCRACHSGRILPLIGPFILLSTRASTGTRPSSWDTVVVPHKEGGTYCICAGLMWHLDLNLNSEERVSFWHVGTLQVRYLAY